jgi:two-component system nitrogen regulation response regulator GlnG
MKGRILVIDDEAEIRRNLTLGLTQEGYSAVACPDGISAIHELDKAREKGIAYDYLVTDIFRPDIDGLKILKVIKNQCPELPVLVITGYGDVSLESEAFSEYNTGYLGKVGGIVKTAQEDDTAIIQLGSGRYFFEYPARKTTASGNEAEDEG